MHEFRISYSHTVWYLFFARGEIIIAYSEASPIKTNKTINYTKMLRKTFKLYVTYIYYSNYPSLMLGLLTL